jgi:predicted AAA+ superfamily ATPase
MRAMAGEQYRGRSIPSIALPVTLPPPVTRSRNHLSTIACNGSKTPIFFFPVKIFDASLARQNVNPRKGYCIDHALVASIHSNMLINNGHFLENCVFIHLRSQGKTVYYYRTKKGKEVDFVWYDTGRKIRCLQVCWSMEDPVTARRETGSLFDAMEECKCKDGTIITAGEETVIKKGGFYHTRSSSLEIFNNRLIRI